MRFLTAVFAFLLLAPALTTPVRAAPTFPALTGRVVDDAHILNDQTVQDLNGKLAALETKTSRQLVVVTLFSLQGYDIADYGYQLGRAWGIGHAKLNNGALLIIAPTEHRARIEVGYGLEPIVTDALSSVILQQAVLPRFRTGDFNGGAEAGADALIQQLSLDTSTAEQRAAVAAQTAQNDEQQGGQSGSLGGLIAFLFVVFALLRVFGGWGILPLLFMGGGRGGFGGGGFGGGGFGGGGGGFGGGGGGFGGGGASGGW